MKRNRININHNKTYPFGSVMARRTYTASSTEKYRFGFNTQQKDDEIYGNGNAMSAQFWEYGARLGRRWNVDPVVKVWQSGYSCFGNNPIFSVDILGNNEGDYYSTETGQKLGSDGVDDGKSYIGESLKYNSTKDACNNCTPESLKNQLSSISKEIASNQVSRYQKTIGQYNTLITDAKSKGYNVTTKLLQHFIDGSGTTMKISSKWLQKNGAVQDAEEKNQERFEEQILDKYESLKNGQTFLLEDYWDAMATSSVFSELYYASGTFTVKSSASIELARNGENVSVMGKVTIIWQDTYDWHDGLSAFIPGHGTISDFDALFLQQFGKAKPFNMESSWQRSLSGNISINQYWLDSSDFNWK